MKRSELFFTFILLPLDVAMFVIAFILAYYSRLRIDSTPFSADFGIRSYLLYCAVILPIMIAIFAINTLYKTRSYNGFWQQFYKILMADTATILVLIVIIFLSKSLFFSRLILLFIWLFSVLTISIGRFILIAIQRYLLRHGIGRRNILLIGDKSKSETLLEEISSDSNPSYRFVGFISSENSTANTEIKNLGSLDNIALILKKHKIDEVILIDSKLAQSKILEIIQICQDSKVGFKYVPDLFSMMTSSFQPALVGSIPVMELKPILLDGWGRITKRIFDILFSLILLIILSPLMLLIAILIKITSPGPVFYSHERIGRDERKFKFYKFRSMYQEKCDYQGGIYWTTKEDEHTRITPLGRLLRKTNLDEIPQIWNIFIGEMSFVGPRPELPKLVEKFEKEIPEYFRRHKVKAGLTGWAQVNGLKGDTSIHDRVRYDIYYIENWSLWLDFKIALKTIGLLLYEAIAGKYEYRTRSRVDN